MTKPKFTMASDIIKQLQSIVDNHGDYPVSAVGEKGWTSSVYVNAEPYYYDGGYCAPDADDSTNFIRSRELNGSKTDGFPEHHIKIGASGPAEHDDKINSRPLREIVPEEWDWYDRKELEEMEAFDGEIVKYKTSKQKVNRLECYAFIAYLESGLEAVGDSEGNMNNAKESLLRKFKALKRLKMGSISPAELLTSEFASERDIATIFLREKENVNNK